jgi:hypothetical protein
MKKVITSILLFFACFIQAQIRYYRQLPELSLSQQYKVEVKQGGTVYKEIFTYQIVPNGTGIPTKNDQFANFGFNPSGGAVQIKVTRKDGLALTTANSKLVNKMYDDVITSFASGALIINCPSVKKHLYVSVNGKTEYPLLIFVDPFADTPIPANAKVVTFAASNQAYVQTAQYDRYTIPNDVDAVVIEDGAMIKGTIHTASGRTKPLIVTGRGVLMGNGEVLHGPENIPYNALVITKGKNHLVENIMVVNSRHFTIDIGDNSTLDNAKMYGYDSNNDGIVGGNYSLIKNVFSKVNDDHIKLYNDNMKVQNCTFWSQTNGGLLQLAWNSIVPGVNCLVENCEVIEWTSNCGDPKLGQGGVARTFLSLRSTDAQPRLSNLTMRNIHIQGQLDRFIGINGKYDGSKSLGFENILFENVTIDNTPDKYSWIYTGDSPFKIGITFKNVTIAGKCMTASNHQINTEGNVVLTYQNCSVVTDIQEETILEDKILYPNPAVDIIYIPKESIPSVWKIYSSKGEMVLFGASDNASIEILPDGIYVLKRNDKTYRFTKQSIF